MIRLDKSEISRHLGDCHVVDDAEDIAAVNTATFHTTQKCRVIIQPPSLSALVQAVQFASEHKLTLHVVSRGKNWGFGSRVPVQDTDILLDLSRMNRILSYDREFGTVRVEPGVTFHQLSAFLRDQGQHHFLNTIGGSPHASVLGNLLERGDGVGPFCERADHACSPEVVLANGRVVGLGFANVANSRVADLCKSGLGPNFQELFVQSNFGIVSKMTIWLHPVPEHFTTITFSMDERHDLSALLDKLQGLYRRRVLTAPITFWNDYKQVATSIQYPFRLQEQPPPLRRATLKAISNNYSTWTGFGGIYVDHRAIARRIEREIFRQLEGLIRKPSWLSRLDDRKMAVFRWLNRFLRKTRFSFDQLLHSWQHHPLLGHPTELSVRSVFWRKKRAIPRQLDPDRQFCGVLWNSFVLPFQGELVAGALAHVDELVLTSGFEPIVSFVLVNDRYIRVFQQLVYDRENREEEERALACHARVFSYLEDSGYSHNRLDIRSMASGDTLLHDGFLHQAIKDALDPDGMISPGRYFIQSTSSRS